MASLVNTGVVDPHKTRPGYVEGNDHALPYYSRHFSENDIEVGGRDAVLKHVNCSYLSTPGRPPTLEALKRHAQSLTALIGRFAPSSSAGEVDGMSLFKDDEDPTTTTTTRGFVADEAFDWLDNLHAPYESFDPQHHRPLNSLVNLVEANSETRGAKFHCPLEEHQTSPEAQANGGREDLFRQELPVRPYAGHENLLAHANECLEMLDHEYSATGGLMSILPTGGDLEAEQLGHAGDTLIGQWLLYTQHLVSRMHDLEIMCAQNLELLAGEALVPMQQHLGAHGPDGRSGRGMVFPQDRWILANAGDEVLDFLHQALDKKEQASDEADQRAMRQGTVGAALHVNDDKLRGIVHLDLNTRFYRLKGEARGPIFVLPAYADRPDTAYTRDIETRPTVVAVPEPTYPERTSEWLKKNEGVKQAKVRAENECDELRRQNGELQRQNQAIMLETERYRDLLNMYVEQMRPDGEDGKDAAQAL